MKRHAVFGSLVLLLCCTFNVFADRKRPAQGAVAPGGPATFGAVTADSYGFTGDADTKIANPSSDVIAFTTGSIEQLRIVSNYIRVSDASTLIFGTGFDARFYGNGTDALVTLDGDGAGTTDAKLAVSGIAPMSSSGTLILYDEGGDAALTVGAGGSISLAQTIYAGPADKYSWSGDTDTWIAAATADVLTFVTGGTTALTLDASQDATFAGQVLIPDGDRFGWATDTDTYIDRNASDTIRFVMGGATRVQINTTGLQVNDDSGVKYGTGGDYFEQGENTTLTDGVATTVFSMVTGDGDMCGFTLHYTVRATDGTEYQSETGTVMVALCDDAGGVVASTATEVSVQITSNGGGSTLTTDWTVVTTDDQSIEIQLDADSSLTTTEFNVDWHIVGNGDFTISVP